MPAIWKSHYGRELQQQICVNVKRIFFFCRCLGFLLGSVKTWRKCEEYKHIMNKQPTDTEAGCRQLVFEALVTVTQSRHLVSMVNIQGTDVLALADWTEYPVIVVLVYSTAEFLQLLC